MEFTSKQRSGKRAQLYGARKKIETKDAKITKATKASELSDKDLDKVAGGANYSTTKSNVKTNA